MSSDPSRLRLNTAWSRVWAMALIVGALTQLTGWVFGIESAMLSNHVDARIHQGVTAVAFMLIFWLLWHWGLGRRMAFVWWIDGAFILAGLAYWYVSLRWPAPW